MSRVYISYGRVIILSVFLSEIVKGRDHLTVSRCRRRIMLKSIIEGMVVNVFSVFRIGLF
jgi:hypothetical protein